MHLTSTDGNSPLLPSFSKALRTKKRVCAVCASLFHLIQSYTHKPISNVHVTKSSYVNVQVFKISIIKHLYLHTSLYRVVSA